MMEAHLENELRGKLISKCLKMEIELKRLLRKKRVKETRNSQIERHNQVLEDKLAMMKLTRQEIRKNRWQELFALKECCVVLTSIEIGSRKSPSKSASTDQASRTQQTLKVIKCSFLGCKKTFPSKSSLNNHKNIHTTKYQCRFCHKRYPTSSQLKQHLRNHTGQRPFECIWQIGEERRICGQQFKQRHHLDNHVKLVHMKGRPYKCNKKGCDKAFAIESKLQRHVNEVHSSRQSFKCREEGCDKKFKSKEHLTRHQKNVHSNLKEVFRCDFENCERSFDYRHNLIRHQKDDH